MPFVGPISDATDTVTTLPAPPPPEPAPPPPPPTPALAAPVVAAQPIPQPGTPLVDTAPGVFMPAPSVITAPSPSAVAPTTPLPSPVATTDGTPDQRLIPQPGRPLIDVGDHTEILAPPVAPSGIGLPEGGTPPILGSESELPKLGASGRYTHLQLEQFWVLANGFPGAEDVAAAIMQAESGGDPTSINNTARPARPHYHPPAKGNLPEYSVGLAQINLLAHPTYTEKQMLDPLANVKAMVAISNGGRDFTPWSTYTSGAYKAYLTGALAPEPVTQPAKAPKNPNAPPGVQKAWANVIGQFSGHVPAAHARVKSLSDELIGVFK